MGRLISVVLACCLATAGTARAQTLDKEISGLADKLSKALVSKGCKSVAAVDFTDLQRQPTELGRFLSERLAVEIVSTDRVSMVDRANIKSILAEHKLTEEGLVNPANAKRLGEFAGVDTILTGNVTALDDGIELMVKAILTDSAKIVAAGRIIFKKTPDIQDLLNRGVSSNGTAN
jgi:curli biogenesis system outer membrane secretion channel CsgG